MVDPLAGESKISINEKYLDDDEPNVIFKKMVISDREQNRRLSCRASKGKGLSGREILKTRRKGPTRVRFAVCTLGLISLLLSSMSRSVINVTITSMIHPSMIETKSVNITSEGSCPSDSMKIVSKRSIDGSQPETYDPIYSYFTDKPETSINTEAPVSMSVDSSATDTEQSPFQDMFKWTIKEQSVLLGGFYYSYFFFMILGEQANNFHELKMINCLTIMHHLGACW